MDEDKSKSSKKKSMEYLNSGINTQQLERWAMR